MLELSIILKVYFYSEYNPFPSQSCYNQRFIHMKSMSRTDYSNFSVSFHTCKLGVTFSVTYDLSRLIYIEIYWNRFTRRFDRI